VTANDWYVGGNYLLCFSSQIVSTKHMVCVCACVRVIQLERLSCKWATIMSPTNTITDLLYNDKLYYGHWKTLRHDTVW